MGNDDQVSFGHVQVEGGEGGHPVLQDSDKEDRPGGRGQWDERRQGTDPRRTSSSEKWEEADKPTKEKKTGREVRGDPRGGSRKPTGKGASVLSEGVSWAVGRSLCSLSALSQEWQLQGSGRGRRTKQEVEEGRH